MRERLSVLATLLGLTLLQPANTAAALTQTPAQVTQERLILIAGVKQVLIWDRLVLGPHDNPLYWAPPKNISSAESRSAGAAWMPGRKEFLILPWVRQATFLYLIDSASAGLSIPWQRSLRVQELWVYTGPGISVPIELNQYLYAQGSAWLGGTEFARADAADLPPGPLRLNVEIDPPPPPVFYEGLWIVLGGALIWVASLWWSRMPRRSREVD